MWELNSPTHQSETIAPSRAAWRVFNKHFNIHRMSFFSENPSFAFFRKHVSHLTGRLCWEYIQYEQIWRDVLFRILLWSCRCLCRNHRNSTESHDLSTITKQSTKYWPRFSLHQTTNDNAHFLTLKIFSEIFWSHRSSVIHVHTTKQLYCAHWHAELTGTKFVLTKINTVQYKRVVTAHEFGLISHLHQSYL